MCDCQESVIENSSEKDEVVTAEALDETVPRETEDETVPRETEDETVPRETEDETVTEYKILHPVLFTYMVQEAVAFDATERTYWIEKIRKPDDAEKSYEEQYLFFPMSDELYEEFAALREEFCKRSGEPFYQGDPLVVHAENVFISTNTYIGKAENWWNFDANALRLTTPITVPASLITNLDVPLKVIHA